MTHTLVIKLVRAQGVLGPSRGNTAQACHAGNNLWGKEPQIRQDKDKTNFITTSLHANLSGNIIELVIVTSILMISQGKREISERGKLVY